jgi:mannose/fructose/N-acetylgalactosamine-specific phosphotransferase system component IIC
MKQNHLLIGAGIALVLLMLMSGGVATSPDADVNAAVALALSKETDPSVLRTFATKLRNAGHYSQADAIDARAALLEGQQQEAIRQTIQSTTAYAAF